MVFSTSNTAATNPDRGWFEAIFAPCLFRSTDFGPWIPDILNSTKLDHITEFWVFPLDNEASFSLTQSNSGSNNYSYDDPTWNAASLTLTTGATPILTGDPEVSAHSRFIFEFSVHNELNDILNDEFPEDLGTEMNTTEEEKEFGCSFWRN